MKVPSRHYLVLLLAAASCATSAERMRARATDPPAAGMAVVDPDGAINLPLGPVVEDVLCWWSERFPQHERRIRDFAARGTIIVRVQAGGMVHYETGTAPQRGLTRDNVVMVLWDTLDGGASFEPTLRHELGHVALHAMAFGGDTAAHHAYMAALGCPWAAQYRPHVQIEGRV